MFGFSIFSSGNFFSVDGFAKRSLIISTVAAAIGLFIGVVHLLWRACAITAI